MEKDLHIPTPDGRVIYGKSRGQVSDALVILVHGLTAHMDNHRFYNGARYLSDQRDFPTARFNFYGDEKDARKLVNCTLKLHATDLDIIISHFRSQGVQRIGVVGHSYGGPVILLGREKVDAAVLWDPSFAIQFEDLEYVRELELYRSRGGVEYLFNPEMIEEARQLPWEDLTKGFSAPLKVICAGRGILREGGKIYVEKAEGPAELKVIEGADHSFNEDGAAEQLFEETAAWLETYLS